MSNYKMKSMTRQQRDSLREFQHIVEAYGDIKLDEFTDIIFASKSDPDITSDHDLEIEEE